MKQFTPEQKHSILLEYVPLSATHSFAALAARHGVASGRKTVEKWHRRWNGSASSLQHKAVSGRPRALSKREVQQHVRMPILRANRAHKAVHYPAVAALVRQKTGKEVSLPTLRRYGKEELGARQRKGKKRTAQERECTHGG
jgi:transposase